MNIYEIIYLISYSSTNIHTERNNNTGRYFAYSYSDYNHAYYLQLNYTYYTI